MIFRFRVSGGNLINESAIKGNKALPETYRKLTGEHSSHSHFDNKMQLLEFLTEP